MNPSIESARNKWRATEPGTRVMLFVGIAAVVVAGLLVQNRLNQVDWGVLYANVDDTTASEVLAALDSRGIQYKVEGNGTRILVPKDQISTTRVALAGDGISGTAVPQGFDDLFPSSGLGSSDRQEQINYQRALEGELARTLLAMEPVAGARVQLSIPEQSLFIGSGTQDTAKPTASVMLQLRRDLDRNEVDAIANLVASAVPKLSTNDVTIASSDGQLLKAPADDSDPGAADVKDNLQYQSDLESTMSKRLTELVRSMTGRSDATVSVHAEMDFTQSTTEDVTITSDTVISRQDVTLETWNGTGSNPNGSVGTDGGPGTNASGAGEYTKEHRVTEATPINSTTQQITSLTPTLKALHVAVVVPQAAATANASGVTLTKEDVTKFVEDAAGLNKNGRVDDTISVSLDAPAATVTDNTGLVTDDGGTVTDATASNAQELPLDLLVIAGCGGAFLMLLLSLFGRRKARRARKEAKALEKAMRGGKKKRKKGEPDATEILPQIPVAPMPADPERVAADEIKRDLERMVGESPESLAALLSTWMAK